ncbi:hypothetical protein CEXT_500691 [Caerostris extrusa]|uniref:Uncharacterized protein n=1 Tax=Caerostris extrusa TaxID=172846 RepID=A0AAV4NHB6_CAEEX|nr:hypothetical protein CEXT_500691 [Caerostris extrusa]
MEERQNRNERERMLCVNMRVVFASTSNPLVLICSSNKVLTHRLGGVLPCFHAIIRKEKRFFIVNSQPNALNLPQEINRNKKKELLVQLLDLINAPVLFHRQWKPRHKKKPKNKKKKKKILHFFSLQPIKPPLTHLVEQHFGVAPKQKSNPEMPETRKIRSSLTKLGLRAINRVRDRVTGKREHHKLSTL